MATVHRPRDKSFYWQRKTVLHLSTPCLAVPGPWRRHSSPHSKCLARDRNSSSYCWIWIVFNPAFISLLFLGKKKKGSLWRVFWYISLKKMWLINVSNTQVLVFISSHPQALLSHKQIVPALLLLNLFCLTQPQAQRKRQMWISICLWTLSQSTHVFKLRPEEALMQTEFIH